MKLRWVVLIGALTLALGLFLGYRAGLLMAATTCLELDGKWDPYGYCYDTKKLPFDG